MVIALCYAVSLSWLWGGSVHAKAIDVSSDWSEPETMFQVGGAVWSPRLLVDGSGGLHQVWVEAHRPDETYDAIFYSSFENGRWLPPRDVLVGQSIRFLDATVSADNILHLVWSDRGLRYSSVPLGFASRPTSWSEPYVVDPGNTEDAAIAFDSQGTLYIAYNSLSDIPGVFIVKSQNRGSGWEASRRISDELKEGQFPSTIDMAADPSGALYVVWSLVSAPYFYPPLGLSFAKLSPNDGEWSSAVWLQEGPYSQPSIITSGFQSIFVVWSVIASIRERQSSSSSSGGQIWEQQEVFANGLAGLSTWSPLVVANNGVIYSVVDSDSPQAIFSVSWSKETGWSDLVNISRTDFAETGTVVGTPSLALTPDQTLFVSYIEGGIGYRFVSKRINAPASVRNAAQLSEIILPDLLAQGSEEIAAETQHHAATSDVRHFEIDVEAPVVIHGSIASQVLLTFSVTLGFLLVAIAYHLRMRR